VGGSEEQYPNFCNHCGVGMNFFSPLWFFVLPLILLLPWIRGERPFEFSNIAILRSKKSLRLRLSFILPLMTSIVLVALLVSLARPHKELKEKILEKEGVDIMLVMDTSGSMGADDFQVNGLNVSRMDISKKVMKDFVQQRPNDRIGMVLFGEEAYTYVPLTLDHSGMITFLDRLEVGAAGGGATSIGDGIAIAAKRMLEKEHTSKVMILVTDGRSNSGVNPLDAGSAAAEFGIRIYTVGIGKKPQEVSGFFAKQKGVDEASLTKISSVSGGKFFRAEDTTSLTNIYSEIDTLEPTTAEFVEYVYLEEQALPWIVTSALGLLMFLILSETWLRRFP
jgi:Ca-activated chloride channel homolog